MRVSAQPNTVRQEGNQATQPDQVASSGFTDGEAVGEHWDWRCFPLGQVSRGVG